jgi:Tfp pilus assembly protein PilW
MAEEGMSLTELLVAMFLTAIVMGLVSNMFINVAEVTTNSNSTNRKSSAAANMMDATSEVIRSTANNPVAASNIPDPGVISASNKALTVMSFVDTVAKSPVPTKVGYRVDTNGMLIEDRWATTSTQAPWVFAATATSRTLGGPILTPSGTSALFTYIEADGTAFTLADNATLGETDRRDIASIRVTITIANQLTTGSDPIVVMNTVGMPNLNLLRTEE